MPRHSPLRAKEQDVALILLFAFISVPILEIALFIEVGERIGLWSTLGIVVLTAIVGTLLLRHQGFETLRRVQTQLNAGELPLQELFDGLCLLIAGAVLLTPGFFTDAVGFLLMVPALRRHAAGALLAQIAKRGHVHMHGSRPRHQSQRAPGVIDGEFEDITRGPSSEPGGTAPNKLPTDREHGSSTKPTGGDPSNDR